MPGMKRLQKKNRRVREVEKDSYEVTAKVTVDSREIDEAIKKLEKLIELTKEANMLGVSASAKE